jgi:hypothetical protein
MTRINVDEVRGAIASLIADRVASQARSNIGEVVWSVIVPIVTVGRTVLCQNGVRSNEEEDEIGCCKQSQHVALRLEAFRPRIVHSAGPIAYDGEVVVVVVAAAVFPARAARSFRGRIAA